MKVHKDFLTDEQFNFLRSSFDDYADNHKLTFKYWIDHEDTIKEVFKSDVKRLIQQERTDARNDTLGQYVRELMKSVIALPTTTNIWVVRSHNPIGIHVDSDEIKKQHGRTFLIPLTFDDRIKTVVWDRVSTISEFNKFCTEFANNHAKFEKLNDISSELLLNNCWFGEPSITDYIPVEGIATWEPNVLIEFNREKLHSSNNYTTFVPFKDYILVHTDE